MDPLTALTAAQGGLQAGMSLYQGFYQGQVADNNAKLATWNASAAMQKANLEAQDVDMENAGKIGELVASQSASGIALGSGSSIQTRASAAKLGRIDTLRTVYKGQLEANQFLNQAQDYRSQASISRIGGAVGALGSFLGAGVDIYKQKSFIGAAQAYS